MFIAQRPAVQLHPPINSMTSPTSSDIQEGSTVKNQVLIPCPVLVRQLERTDIKMTQLAIFLTYLASVSSRNILAPALHPIIPLYY